MKPVSRKSIKLSAPLLALVKADARRNGRTITGQLEYLLKLGRELAGRSL